MDSDNHFPCKVTFKLCPELNCLPFTPFVYGCYQTPTKSMIVSDSKVNVDLYHGSRIAALASTNADSLLKMLNHMTSTD